MASVNDQDGMGKKIGKSLKGYQEEEGCISEEVSEEVSERGGEIGWWNDFSFDVWKMVLAWSMDETLLSTLHTSQPKKKAASKKKKIPPYINQQPPDIIQSHPPPPPPAFFARNNSSTPSD